MSAGLRLRELANQMGLGDLTPELADVDEPVKLGYASDLLSDVLAHAPAGAILVTAQAHLNVIAVASHVGLAAVVFSGGVEPSTEVLQRAVQEGIPSFRSSCPTFDVAGKLYSLGLRGGIR